MKASDVFLTFIINLVSAYVISSFFLGLDIFYGFGFILFLALTAAGMLRMGFQVPPSHYGVVGFFGRSTGEVVGPGYYLMPRLDVFGFLGGMQTYLGRAVIEIKKYE